jgi:hypothetical protein
VLTPESCLSTGEAIRTDLVRGDGGGDQFDLASANVGARLGCRGAGDTGESGGAQGIVFCRGGTTLRFNVGMDCCLVGSGISKAVLFQASIVE